METFIQQNKKELAGAIIIAIVSFYGGMKYDQSKNASFSSPTPNSAQNGLGRMGGQRGGGMRAFNGASGSIVAKDATSITLSLRDGSGSKIIFVSPSTLVSKSVTGSESDLLVGKEVSVNGTANSDGSINAQSIQLRPNFATSTPR